ncbi:MAG: hypothetical protein HRT45_13205 [Bdellovibrionales bacterium]|nr:hypothetical protein [Bdellovibrionales bacterium]
MKRRLRPLILTPLLGLFWFCQLAEADSYYLRALSSLDFYSGQSDQSALVATLPEGEEFYLSKTKYGEWRKALLEIDFEQRVGWIKLSQLQGNAKRLAEPEADLESAESDQPPTGRYFGRTGIGLAYTQSFMQWGERSFVSSDDTEWEIAEATSNTGFLTVFADLKMGRRLVIRPFANLRTTEFQGVSSSEFLDEQETSFRQTFRGLGLQAKFYRPSGLWWWGLAAEGAQGQKLSVEFAGDSIKTRDEDLSFYIIGIASIGRDFSFTEDIYFLPEIRAGAVLNQEPTIFMIEASFGIGYALD